MTDRPRVPPPSRTTPAPLDDELKALLPPLSDEARAEVVEALADLAIAHLVDAGLIPADWDTIPDAADLDRPGSADPQ